MSERLAGRLVHNADSLGLPCQVKTRKNTDILTSNDLIERSFARAQINALWGNGIMKHRARKGKFDCSFVMDTCSRRIVRWSINTVQDSALVINTLDVAISQRTVCTGGRAHTDHGVQFTSWASTERVHGVGSCRPSVWSRTPSERP